MIFKMQRQFLSRGTILNYKRLCFREENFCDIGELYTTDRRYCSGLPKIEELVEARRPK
jgi:hypothetical protein